MFDKSKHDESILRLYMAGNVIMSSIGSLFIPPHAVEVKSRGDSLPEL